MSIAEKLQTILENEQKVYNAGYEKGKSEGGGGENKLAGLIDGTTTELTAQDLAGAKKINSYAFYRNGYLKSIEIPDSVTKIYSNAFERSYLRSIKIPDSVTMLDSYVFYDCPLLYSVVLGNSITSIPYYCFNSCTSLASIEIPNSVTTIEAAAFQNCPIASVFIPASLKKLKSAAFYNCKSLKRVDFSNHTSIPSLESANAFQNTHADLQIKVPESLIDEWKAATNWVNYADKIVTEFTNTL